MLTKTYVELVHVDTVFLLAHVLLLLFALRLLLCLPLEILWVGSFIVGTLPLFKNVANHLVSVVLRVELRVLLGHYIVKLHLLVKCVLHLICEMPLFFLFPVSLVILLLSLLHCSFLDKSMLQLFLSPDALEFQISVVLINLGVLTVVSISEPPLVELLVLIL